LASPSPNLTGPPLGFAVSRMFSFATVLRRCDCEWPLFPVSFDFSSSESLSLLIFICFVLLGACASDLLPLIFGSCLPAQFPCSSRLLERVINLLRSPLQPGGKFLLKIFVRSVSQLLRCRKSFTRRLFVFQHAQSLSSFIAISCCCYDQISPATKISLCLLLVRWLPL
jgi:hypothetical protein